MENSRKPFLSLLGNRFAALDLLLTRVPSLNAEHRLLNTLALDHFVPCSLNLAFSPGVGVAIQRGLLEFHIDGVVQILFITQGQFPQDLCYSDQEDVFWGALLRSVFFSFSPPID